MTTFQAFLQGMLQGFTEFLPVSSSGHLSLFQYFTGAGSETGFAFSILLHAGTLVAVCICFFKQICRLIYEAVTLVSDLATRRFHPRRMSPDRRTLLFLILSTMPLVLMLFLKDAVEKFSTDQDITIEGFCFLVTALLLLTASRHSHGSRTGATINSPTALTIGVAQVIATMPGISRSGSTISAGLLCGLERSYAVSYSFILGIPAVLGAVVFEIGDAVQEGITLPLSVLVVGFVSSLVFGLLSIKLVQWLIKGDKFRYFGYYTLALGVLCLVIGFADQFTGHAIQGFVMGR